MNSQEHLSRLLMKQQEITRDIEALIAELDAEGTLSENKRLQADLAKLRSEHNDLTKRLAAIHQENTRLRMALSEQIFSEKLSILKISRRKVELYFQREANQSWNRLAGLEAGLQNRIDDTARELETELLKDQEALQKDLGDLRSRINAVAEDRKRELATEWQATWEEVENKYRQLQAEDVSEETIQRRMRQNNLEINLGLGWLNRLGLLLILLGVATALQYSYSHWFTPYIKGIFIFVLGLIFLSGGEFLTRRQKNIFSLGLSAVGSAILYYATFSSYFYLHIVSINVAIFLALLVTILTIALSLRYDSKAICIYALIGGYLPFFSYVFLMGLNPAALYLSMGYIFLLNAMVLVISLFKKWHILNYLAFILNLPVFIYLIGQCREPIPALLFTAAVFTLYLFIIISYSLRHKLPLNLYDIILLGSNTTVSCITAYWIFGTAGWSDFRGLLAMVLALFYYLLGRVIEHQMDKERLVRGIFYLTALTFAVLMVPFQFGIVWMSIGWTIEALFMIIYGIKARIRMLEGVGWVVLALTWMAFAAADLPRQHLDPLFNYKYTLIVAAMLIAILFYLKNRLQSLANDYPPLPAVFTGVKYYVLLNVLVYLYNTFSYFYSHHFTAALHVPSSLTSYYFGVGTSLIMVLFVLFIVRTPLLQDKVVNYAAAVLLAYIDLKCIFITIAYPLFSAAAPNRASVLALAVLLLYHLFVLLNIKWIILKIMARLRYNLELYPLTVGLYAVLAVGLLLKVQLGWLPYSPFVLSAGNMLLALVFVLYGMRQGYIYLRRAGLLLAVLVSAKLFLIDLSHLETLGKIVAYFSFGLVLLAISYLYQRLERAYAGVLHQEPDSISQGD